MLNFVLLPEQGETLYEFELRCLDHEYTTSFDFSMYSSEIIDSWFAKNLTFASLTLFSVYMWSFKLCIIVEYNFACDLQANPLFWWACFEVICVSKIWGGVQELAVQGLPHVQVFHEKMHSI